MSKELKFVTRNYRRGVLDVRRAYRATLSKAGRRQKSEIRWMAAAAVIVVLLVGGAIAYMLPRQARETTIAAGQQNRVVTLADGTRVTLAPHSSIMYADDCRDIEMTGRAYFDIRHDASRPFVIHDTDYVIRDIGTKLVVEERMLGGGQKTTSVYVAQGSVYLIANAAADGVIVGAGDMYQISSSATKPVKVGRLPSENSLTAWATHEFHFDGTPLPQVLDDLSAYYHVDLSCPNGQQKRLTADFRADSLDSIINMIEETLDVDISRK